MNKALVISLLFLGSIPCRGELPSQPNTIIYLFHGQGADQRQFKELVIPEGYDTVHISYPIPLRRETMSQYALRFVPMINIDAPYVLLGVSLGGMICTELTDTLNPENTILISSAKSYEELPGRYNFQKKIPLNRIIPKGLTKAGARFLQGIVEPDRRYDKATFKDMLKKKDASYLNRTVDMIVHWERTEYPESIVHIHGDADHTIPVKNVDYDYLVEDGSHMMVLTRAADVSRILESILNPVNTK
jgi:pimeloyl-ACP methyl ester carboxylesterase